MPTPIDLSLASLLPTVSPLPDELVNLAASLVAQSRSKATTLKPEEEIGRTYACCHIACQRLGHWLALDIAKPTPPVNPKIYSKLHTYLNSVLRTQTTPRRKAAGTTQARNTPSSARLNAQLRDDKVTAKTKPATAEPTPIPSETATPRSRKRKADAQDDKSADSASRLDNAANTESLITDATKRASAQTDPPTANEEVIPHVSQPSKTPLRRKEKHVDVDGDDLGPAGLLPGLGTMFQPAVDWLSDERQQDYADWKHKVLRQMMVIERNR